MRSPKLYELLIKTELKGDTAMDLNNFFNHIKMCLNAVTRIETHLDVVKEVMEIHISVSFEFCIDEELI